MTNPEQQQTVQVETQSLLGRQVETVSIQGNRVTDPVARLEYVWKRLLVPPADPIDLGLDAGIWMLSTSALVLSASAFPLFLLPLLAGTTGVSFAVWYVRSLRLAAIYRIVLVTLGLLLVL